MMTVVRIADYGDVGDVLIILYQTEADKSRLNGSRTGIRGHHCAIRCSSSSYGRKKLVFTASQQESVPVAYSNAKVHTMASNKRVLGPRW